MTFRINVWGARGRWFESSHPDIVENIDNLMIVDAFCFYWHSTKQISRPTFTLSLASSGLIFRQLECRIRYHEVKYIVRESIFFTHQSNSHFASKWLSIWDKTPKRFDWNAEAFLYFAAANCLLMFSALQLLVFQIQCRKW